MQFDRDGIWDATALLFSFVFHVAGVLAGHNTSQQVETRYQ